MTVLQMPMDILTQFPVRKSRAQKAAFRQEVTAWAEKLGYCVTVEQGSFGSRNVVIGDPDHAGYVLSAHYDTCARMVVSNRIMPENSLMYGLYQIYAALVYTAVPMAVSILLAIAAWVSGAAMYPLEHSAERLLLLLLVWVGSFAVLCGVSLALAYFGPANPSNANDNTSGVVTLLEIMRTLPENQRSKVCFVLFDQEETGLWGARSYRKAHRDSLENQLVLSLNCVGDGDFIRIYPSAKLRRDKRKLTSLYKVCGYFGKKNVLVSEKGCGNFPSDHKLFPWAVCMMALRKGKTGLYLDKIHTAADVNLEETNVNILRAAITSFITCDAAQYERKK